MATDSNIEYNFLGNSGLRVSNIALGTMTFGKAGKNGTAAMVSNFPKQLEEAGAHKLMDKYVELGGNFIDTADVYATGEAEEIVGSWLKKQNRDNIIVATKVGLPMDDTNPYSTGLSRKWILKACEDSLRRLQTDYIDLYQAHVWDSGTPLEETLRAFDDLIRCGKIRYYGYSNVCGYQLQKIVETARRLNISLPVSLQQQYSLLKRDPEWEEFMVCEAEGLGILPWSPLNGGLLTGRFKRGEVPDAKDSRAGYMKAQRDNGNMFPLWGWDDVKDSGRYWRVIEVMQKLAKNHEKSVAQVALRWVLQRKCVTSILAGVTTIEQLEDNIGAATGWELTEEEMKELCNASETEIRYPYDMITHCGRINPFKR